MPYLLHHPKIPLLWIRLNPNPQLRVLGMEQVWHFFSFIRPHQVEYSKTKIPIKSNLGLFVVRKKHYCDFG